MHVLYYQPLEQGRHLDQFAPYHYPFHHPQAQLVSLELLLSSNQEQRDAIIETLENKNIMNSYIHAFILTLKSSLEERQASNSMTY